MSCEHTQYANYSHALHWCRDCGAIRLAPDNSGDWSEPRNAWLQDPHALTVAHLAGYARGRDAGRAEAYADLHAEQIKKYLAEAKREANGETADG